MCEEVRSPASQVPKAMVGTIVLNTVAGLLFLIPLAFVMPDITELVSLPSGQPTPAILKAAIGSSGGAFGLLIPIMILSLICGVACTTAASRCTWAFARDGAIPGSGWWRKVNPRLDVPLNALLLVVAVQLLLGPIYFGSAAAFNAFSGAGVIFLTVSYALPIVVSAMGRRQQLKNAPFNLGRLGVVCNAVALGESSSTNTARKHAKKDIQVGPPSLYPCFVCRPLFQSLQPMSITLAWSSWGACWFPSCGTGHGDTGIIKVHQREGR